MNKTYWVVVKPNGFVCHGTISWWREGAVKSYSKSVAYLPVGSCDEHIRVWWRKEYRKGARCVKVRLVLEE